MTSEHRYDAVPLLLGAYALHAVDEPETDVLERHLATCSDCRRELDEYRETLATLVPPLDPSPELWSRIVSALPGTNGTAAAPPRSAAPRPARRRSLVPALAALTAAAVAATSTLLLTRAPDPGAPASRASLTAQGDPAVRGEAVLYDPGSPDGQLVLDLEGMPAAPNGHHYEVWVLRSTGGGEMEAVGAFSVPADGAVRLELPLPGPGTYRAVDVSLEEDGGSPEHSGTSVASGTFQPA